MTHFHCMESPKKQKGKNEVWFKLDNQETLTEPSEICVQSKYLSLCHFCFFSFFPQCVKKTSNLWHKGFLCVFFGRQKANCHFERNTNTILTDISLVGQFKSASYHITSYLMFQLVQNLVDILIVFSTHLAIIIFVKLQFICGQ